MKKINQLTGTITPILLAGVIALLSFSLLETYNAKGKQSVIEVEVNNVKEDIIELEELSSEKNGNTNNRIDDTNDIIKSDRLRNTEEHESIIGELKSVTYFLKQSSAEFRKMREYMTERDNVSKAFTDSLHERESREEIIDSLICITKYEGIIIRDK